MQKIIIIILVLTAFPLPCFSQQKLFDQPIQIKSSRVSINANAFIATTMLELEFYNPCDSIVEGRQIFKLNRGQVVTGFQLELNGKYRDGSIEEKRKARIAYSSIIGKRIDPAVLQMSGLDNYALNIYPMPAHGSRKVMIKILQLMKSARGKLNYEFPLTFSGKSDALSINIDLAEANLRVVPDQGFLEKSFFINTVSGSHLEHNERNIELNKPISFSILIDIDKPQLFISGCNEESNFLLRFSAPAEKKFETSNKSLAVFWDVSSSAAKRKIHAELNFLESYVQFNKIDSVQIVLFNQQLRETLTWINGRNKFSSIIKYLENYDYNGATQLGNLDLSATQAGVILIFSDGINSFGRSQAGQATVPVSCIISGDDFDKHAIQKIVAATGGQIIELDKYNFINAVAKADSTKIFLLSYHSANNAISINEEFPIWQDAPVLLSGSINKADTLSLYFGNSQGINWKQAFYLNPGPQHCYSGLNEQLSMLRMYDSLMYETAGKDDDFDQQLIFGLLNKVITTQTSYLVLERTEDYIKYNIAPPKELEAQCAEMNYVYNNDVLIKTLLRESEMESLKLLAQSYNQKIQWWDRSLPVINLENFANGMMQQHSTSPISGTAQTKRNLAADNTVISGSAQNLAEVVVTSMGSVHRKSSLGYATSAVRNNELTTGNPVNLQDGLTGKVSGLNIQTTNSGVLSSTRITLRGIRSLTGNNQPLLVLDGMSLPLDYISSINPNDISFVEILKSSSAAAIYGPEGVNGAILVFTKKGFRYNNYPAWREYKLNESDDVDYIKEIKLANQSDLWTTYKELEKTYADEPGFYLDMADVFFTNNLGEKAMLILYEAAEQLSGSLAGKKDVAYVLEKWKKFDDAILIYQSILANDGSNLPVKRDLALAYYQKGCWQKSLDVYYSIIIDENTSSCYDRNLAIKTTALDEMNAVIAGHKDELDLGKINMNLVMQLPVDLRISIEGNRLANHVQIVEPNEEINNCGNQYTKAGGYFSNSYRGYDYCNVYQFEIKQAQPGRYHLKVNLYGSSISKNKAPEILRVIVFKNFQRENQSLEIDNIVVDNQSGVVEIAEIKW